jgi:heme a synthase
MIKQVILYRKMAMATIIAVLLLIAVGGVVRSTGSGMGCPDWPKCFGKWVPPTDISQLPADYKTHFKVMNREIADFNVFHTWTEYINRLLGVLIGFFIIITCWYGWKVKQMSKSIWWLSFAALILVLLEGWLGSIVVKTDLHKGIVTIHMLGSILILMVLIQSVIIASKILDKNENLSFNLSKTSIVRNLGILVTVSILIQVLIGTQVREQVDAIQKVYNNTARNQWVAALGSVFEWHKIFYFIPTILLFFWFKMILENGFGQITWIRNFMKMIVFVLLLEIIIGLVMVNYAIPPFLQPIHLTLAILLLCFCFAITSALRNINT